MIRHSSSHLIEQDFDYVRGIVARNYIGDGPLCAELKRLLAQKFERSAVTLTHSATAALHLCLLALATKMPGKDRVLLGAYVCPEVLCAVMQAGLQPVLVDTRLDSLNLDMMALASRIDARSLAIICTNIGGIADDYSAASAFGIPIISDCAQAIGARHAGLDLASQGLCSVLSFGATKMLSAGAGGAFLGDRELGESVAQLSQSELSVENYRQGGFRATFGQHLGELTAGLAMAQLCRLEGMIARRRQIAHSYDLALRDARDVMLVGDRLAHSNRFRYYFLSDKAAAWIDHLRSRDIDARPSIGHVIPEYLEDQGAFPNVLYIARRVVSVPIFPTMTGAQAALVADALAAGPDRAP
jgi:perosamine synthetase